MIDASDRLIVIATDDDQIAFATPPPHAVAADAIVRDATRVAGPEHTLVLGWNRRGDRLVSLLLTQRAENPGLEAVFDNRFDPTGAEIYLKPAGAFVALGAAVTFHTVIASALEQGATAIGYRLAALAKDPSRGHGIVINPAKREPIGFGPADQVIVLAED